MVISVSGSLSVNGVSVMSLSAESAPEEGLYISLGKDKAAQFGAGFRIPRLPGLQPDVSEVGPMLQRCLPLHPVDGDLIATWGIYDPEVPENNAEIQGGSLPLSAVNGGVFNVSVTLNVSGEWKTAAFDVGLYGYSRFQGDTRLVSKSWTKGSPSGPLRIKVNDSSMGIGGGQFGGRESSSIGSYSGSASVNADAPGGGFFLEFPAP